MSNSATQHIRRVPVKDPRKMFLEAIEVAKEMGFIPPSCTGGLTLHLNQGGLVGTSLDVKNPL